MKTSAGSPASTIFLALSHVPAEKREALLAEWCAGNPTLQAEVERLLAALDLPDSAVGASTALRPRDDAALGDPAGTVVGDFVLIRQIGAGGTGVVYLAHQRHPPRIVALKVLRREFVASAIQRRFEIEAELLGHLQHPGIAQVYAAHPGDAGTPPFIAMELVSGPPLTEYVDAHRLTVRERVELMALVCDAVHHAHQRGIIHRDLKPGNILVTDEGQPKVLDFGVARAAGAQVLLTTVETEAGQLLGTLAYMSPEQVEADPNAIDTRTDIHALGVILFRLLAGRLPFGHDDPPLTELARRILREDPPKLGTIDHALRGDLEVIVARAMAKEKDRRYASASGLGNDLRRYLAGQPISASADSTWYLVRRQIARYRAALAISAAVGVTLAALAFYASVQRGRADQVNVQLQDQLATSTIERARLLSLTGNVPVSEEMVWRELFRQPNSHHAQWTLWDIYSREPSLWSSTVHETGTQTVRFSPDGRSLLTAGRLDGQMRLVDLQSQQIVRTFTAAPASGTLRVFFTAGGRTAVSGSLDGSLRVWDVATGDVLRELVQAAPGLQDLTAAADGARAVTVAAGQVVVWALDSGARVADLSDLVSAPLTVTANADGTVVIVGSSDGTITALDPARRARLWRATGHAGEVISLAVSPAGRVVASGGVDGDLHLWNLTTGDRVRTIASENGRVRNIVFNAPGTHLAAAGVWRTRLWSLERPEDPARDLGISEGVTDLHLHPSGRLLATCNGGSGQVRVWDLAADSRAFHRSGHRGAVTGLAVSADASSIVSAGVDGVVSRWSTEQAASDRFFRSGARVNALAASRSGRWLVSVGQPGTAAVWDGRDGRRTAGLPDVGSARAAVFSDGDRQIVVGELDGTVKTWDFADGVASNPRQLGSPGPPDTEVLAVAARGRYVFAARRSGDIDMRDAATGRTIRTLDSPSAPFSLALSPNARHLAAGTFLGNVLVWDVETGQLMSELKGHTAMVAGVDFCFEGTLLASASRDGSTRLWDIPSGQWLATIAARRPGAERVRFFPDNQRVAIGYEDGEVEVRDLQYFFRYVAGHADYQLRLFRRAGETFPRADEVLAWTQRVLARARSRTD